jgi:hypothetical protein
MPGKTAEPSLHRIMGDEIQKSVDVPGGFLHYPGLGYRDGMCSYSTPGLRIFGYGIPTFRGINATTWACSIRGIRLATAASYWQKASAAVTAACRKEPR